jgi:spore coat-associated protein N
MSPSRKLLLSAALLGAAASIAGLGTYATYTSSTTPVGHTLAAGTVTIALGATGAQTNRLDIGASGIAPGDTIERSVDLVNTSSLALASLTLTTTATASSVLDTDGTNGLQMQIDKCSQAWTESAAPYTYTCGGSTSSVLASRSVIGSDLTLSNLTLSASGGTDRLRVKLTFPSASTIGQGASSTISYQFTATQRAATSK